MKTLKSVMLVTLVLLLSVSTPSQRAALPSRDVPTWHRQRSPEPE